MENRFTSTPSKISPDLSGVESNNYKNTSSESMKIDENHNHLKATGAKHEDNTNIQNIFKVRKSTVNSGSLNIEKTNERLQEAVNREPDPSLYNRPNELPKKISNSSRSTLNSLLQKMTNFRGKKTELQSEKKTSPHLTRSSEVFTNGRNENINQSRKTSFQEEKFKEDIPAFLRRQAN